MLLLKKSNNVHLKYITGILNSKIINYYYKSYFITIDVLKNALLELPIVINKKIEEKVIPLVDRMLSIKKQLQEIGDKKTAQTAKLEGEIKKIDEEIDVLVFKLYDLTEGEMKIIGDGLK